MDESYQVAFDKLKRVLTSAPILAYPDFQLPFQLFTFSTSKVAHLAIAGCKKFLYFAATVVFDTCDSKSSQNNLLHVCQVSQ